MGLARRVAALLLIAGAVSCARSDEGRAPEADRRAGLSRLNPQTLPALRDSFNASSDEARILILLSPT